MFAHHKGMAAVWQKRSPLRFFAPPRFFWKYIPTDGRLRVLTRKMARSVSGCTRGRLSSKTWIYHIV